MQSTLVTQQRTVEDFSRQPMWLYGLVLLDAFMLGGVLAMVLVRDLLVTIMYRLISGEAQGEILNVLDHMLPYQFAFWGAALGLSVLTSAAVLWQTKSWRIAVLPVVAFAALCLLQYLLL